MQRVIATQSQKMGNQCPQKKRKKCQKGGKRG